MIPYIAKRLAMLVVVLLASTVVVFLLLHLAPGNPAVLLNGGHPPTPATLKYFDRLYGLNRPLPVQYLIWLRHLLSGNLGVSAVSRTSVISVIGPRIGLTLMLTAYALVVMVVIGIPLGIFSGIFRNGPVDFFATMGSLAVSAIPNYVTAVVMVALFALEWKLFPAVGGGGTGSLATRLYHLTLPAIALGLASTALASRTTRAAVITELESPHVVGARARGFGEPRVVRMHALRGAMVPIITIVGANAGYLLGGAVVIEQAFGLNGLGNLLVTSVESKDYAVVQAIALFITAEFLVINFIVDLLYGLIDPRVRLAGRAA